MAAFLKDLLDWSPDLRQAAAFVGGYLLGAIPFGLILARIAGLGDIRRIGSGNIGATNVLRAGGKGVALLTLLFDAGKGAAAVLLAQPHGASLGLLAGLGAVIGHLFPIWLGFKGGKGVATGLGALAAVDWRIGVLSAISWAIIAALFRYSSLASLITSAAAPLFAWIWGGPAETVFTLALAVLIWSRHHENISRLLVGNEPRIGASKLKNKN